MTDYSKLTVVKLKDALKERGLPTSGLKAALVERLAEDDNSKAAAASALQAEDEEAQAATTENAPEAQDEERATEEQPARSAPANGPSAHSTPQPPTEQPSVAAAPEPSESQDANLDARSPQTQIPPAEECKPIENGTADVAMEEASVEVPAIQKESLSPAKEVNETVEAAPVDAPAVQESEAQGAQEASQPAVEAEPVPPAKQPPPDSQDVVMTTERSAAPSLASSQMPPPTETTLMPTSTQTTIDPEEVAEDSKKRKRRSQSPPPSSMDTALKKAKTLDGSPRATRIESSERAMSPLEKQESHHTEMSEAKGSAPQPQEHEQDEMQVETQEPQKPQSPQPRRASDAPAPVARGSPTSAKFKGLFAPAPHADNAESTGDNLEDRDVAPALYPTTTALYIRNFMRPLQPNNLKDHLDKLARSAGIPPDQDAILDFYLDSIKTHCLVRFASTAAAARVRLAMHERVWPDERTRKSLWADYVPEGKIPQWIHTEQSAGGGRGAGGKRWEVVYEATDDGVTAELQEADPSRARAGPRLTDTPRNGAPAAAALPPPKAVPVAVAEPRPDVGGGFKTLDDLFRSTAAKPKLYFQPVSEAVAQRRLEKLAEGRGGGRDDEMIRFSFEGETIVDKGPEFGRRGIRRGGFGGGQRYAPRGGGAYGGDRY